MNKQMYDLVKAAIKEGKSIDDVMAEVNAMAQTAQEEMKPKAPLLEKYCKHANSYYVKADDCGRVSRDSLVYTMAAYFVQHGFNPDICFYNEDEFLEHIGDILDRGLNVSKAAADLTQMELEGAPEREILGELIDYAGKMLTDALRDCRD